MKKLSFKLFAAALLFSSNVSFSQSFQWANSYGSIGNEFGLGLVQDYSENIYHTGSYNETVDFDPGAGTQLRTSSGDDDIFIQKLDKLGNLLWIKTIGGGQKDVGENIKLDNQGNLIIIGEFQGSVDFDPGTGVNTLTSSGEYDVFILKLDPNGNFIWAKKIGGSSRELVEGLAIDSTNNIYCSGTFFETSDFNPGSGVFNLTAETAGYTDAYVLKLDNTGNFVWAYSIGAEYDESASSLIFDFEGNLIVYGYFEGSADFNPGTGDSTVTTSRINTFIQKVSPSSAFIEVITFKGFYSYDVVKDSLDNLIFSGTYIQTCDFDPGPGTFNLTSSSPGQDIFILKLDKNLNFIWAVSFGGDTKERACGLAVDNNSSIYVTGLYAGSFVDFDPGPGFKTMTSSGSEDIFVLKLTPTGKYVFAKSLGSSINNDAGWDILVNSKKDIILTGYFSGTTDFDPGSGTTNKTNNGNLDAFVTKWTTCTNSTTSSISRNSCGSYITPSGKRTYNTSGTYSDTIANSIGCDSIITIQLTISPNSYNSITANSCTPYTGPSGKIYSTSGTFKDTIANSVGCDSIITLNLTIGESRSTITTSACKEYQAPSGKIFNASATINDTIPSSSGCDSIITIHLTINPESFSSAVVKSCNQYQSPTGNIYIQTGVYKDTLINYLGCDSIITTDLTITQTTYSSFDTLVCGNTYQSPQGNTYQQTGIYKDTVSNAEGCDSVITINLTINSLDLGVTNISNTLKANQVNGIYQWLDCNQSFSEISGEQNQSYTPIDNGSYAVIVSKDGCTDTSECELVSTIGINEPDIEIGLEIFPNPACDHINLRSNKALIGHIRISDSSGRLIERIQLSKNSTEQRIELELEVGFYFFTIFDMNQNLVFQEKLVIH